MRPFPLAEQVDGINLMRSKGGASPKSLAMLKNGWVSPKRTINARPGSRKFLSFPAGTFGVLGFENVFHTFASAPVANSNPLIVVNVLRHPTGGAADLSIIHRAFPVLGRIYVVAEFADGVIKHYWLDVPTEWAATTTKAFGDRVQPVTDNGYYYELATQDATAAWTANNEVVLTDERQPTAINGFKYEVTAVTGTAPIRTGNTEPTWPTTVGLTVLERRYVTDSQTDPGADDPPTPGPGGIIPGDEYGPFGRGKSTGIDP